MADEIDVANEQAALFLESAIAKARKGAGRPAGTPGQCLNCDEPLAQGLRFCDEDCSADWHERERTRRAQWGEPA